MTDIRSLEQEVPEQLNTKDLNLLKTIWNLQRLSSLMALVVLVFATLACALIRASPHSTSDKIVNPTHLPTLTPTAISTPLAVAKSVEPVVASPALVFSPTSPAISPAATTPAGISNPPDVLATSIPSTTPDFSPTSLPATSTSTLPATATGVPTLTSTPLSTVGPIPTVKPSISTPNQTFESFEFLDLKPTFQAGNYCVAGKIQHSGPQLGLLAILVVLYNDQNNVINGGKFEVSPPKDLADGETMDFEVCADPLAQEVARFELQAFGQ